jgi:hypothetical protein
VNSENNEISKKIDPFWFLSCENDRKGEEA